MRGALDGLQLVGPNRRRGGIQIAPQVHLGTAPQSEPNPQQAMSDGQSVDVLHLDRFAAGKDAVVESDLFAPGDPDGAGQVKAFERDILAGNRGHGTVDHHHIHAATADTDVPDRQRHRAGIASAGDVERFAGAQLLEGVP